MSIKTKILSIVLGLALVAVIVPAGASAALTPDQIQSILNLLTTFGADASTIANVQASLNGTAPVTPPASGTGLCAGISFQRTLVVGSTGSDVKCLQSILNRSAATQVATTGAGSPGNETTYFGQKTLAAVRLYQAAKGFTPANQVGPLTRAALNAEIGGGVVNPPPVPTGAGLTVQLASNNPAAGTVILKQGLAPLAKFTFVNGDNAEVKVTSLKVNRIGISLDSTLSNVYLFNGAVRLTDAASVSSGLITFNETAGLFTVPSGGSTTITVAADLNATAGQTVGVSVNAATSVTTNASSVKGTFPISGNLMTAATATGAGVEFTATTTPSTNTSLTPQNDYTVWQNSAVITTRAVDLTRIAFREIGSVKTSDIQNFRLYVDGVQVGSTIASLDANGYVTFDLSASPKRLEAGSRVIKLVADIIGGSSLNFKFRISVSADANFVDSQYNVNSAPTTATTSGSFTVADVTSGVQTVASGTITFAKKSDSPTGNIVNAASNATLAKYTLTAAGEKVKVENLYVRIIFTNVAGTDDCTAGSTVCTTAASMLLRNGMLLANGVQVGSTTSISPVAAGTLFSLGSSLVVEPGSPVTLEVRGDIYDETGTYNDIDATDTLQVSIIAGSSNAQGLVSLSTISTPSAASNGNTLTVKTGSLSLSKNSSYTNHSVVAPLTAYKVASFNLAAATAESVNVTTINVAVDEVSSYASNLYVKYGANTTTIKPTVAAANAWSINYTLAAGVTIPVDVYMDVSSSMTTGTGTVTVDIDGTTVSSATSADSATVGGQDLTYRSGSFAAEFASAPANQVISGNQQVEVAKYKFTSAYQNYTIQEIKIDPDTATNVSSNAEDIITSAVLKDGTTVLGTENFNNIDTNGSTGGFYFTGLSIPVTGTKVLTVEFNFAVPSATNSTSGLRQIPALTYVKYMDPEGSVSTITDAGTTTYVANSTWVYKAIPTLDSIDLVNPTAIAMNSPIDLYKFKVTAPATGDISLKQFKIALAWSDAGTVDTLELEQLTLLEEGTDITTSVLIQDEDGFTAESTFGVSEEDSYIVVTWLASTEAKISAGENKTYTLRGVPQGFRMTAGVEATDNVSLQLAMDTTTSTAGYDFLTANDAPTGIIELGDAAGSATNEAAVFIWSDNSAVSHSASRTAGTGDWANGYLLKNTLVTENWQK